MAEKDPSISGKTVDVAKRLWALTFLRGVLYVVIGVLLFVSTERGLQWLTWVVAGFVALQGILLLVEAFRARDSEEGGSLWRWIVGGLGVVAGVAILVWPSSSTILLLRLVAIWALVAGVVGVIGAFRARGRRTPGWDWQLANALLWLVFGVVTLSRVTADRDTIALLLGLYLVIAGIVLLVMGFSLRTAAKDAVEGQPA